jgi:hypothetical protein
MPFEKNAVRLVNGGRSGSATRSVPFLPASHGPAEVKADPTTSRTALGKYEPAALPKAFFPEDGVCAGFLLPRFAATGCDR